MLQRCAKHRFVFYIWWILWKSDWLTHSDLTSNNRNDFTALSFVCDCCNSDKIKSQTTQKRKTKNTVQSVAARNRLFNRPIKPNGARSTWRRNKKAKKVNVKFKWVNCIQKWRLKKKHKKKKKMKKEEKFFNLQCIRKTCSIDSLMYFEKKKTLLKTINLTLHLLIAVLSLSRFCALLLRLLCLFASFAFN